MELRPIKTEADYQAALQEIELLFDATPDTPEYDRLDILSTLVEAYEKIYFSIKLPDSRTRQQEDEALAAACASVDELSLGWDWEFQNAAMTDWQLNDQ